MLIKERIGTYGEEYRLYDLKEAGEIDISQGSITIRYQYRNWERELKFKTLVPEHKVKKLSDFIAKNKNKDIVVTVEDLLRIAGV